MPELPEVETYKTYIDNTCLHQKIVAIDCRDDRLLKKPKSDIDYFLLYQEFVKTQRIGKYLFLETTGDKVLVMHFGMTGRPHYYKNEEERPKYGHIQLKFDSGFHFAFENKRKFGWWNLTDTVEAFQTSNGLSNDARDLSLEEFKLSFKNRKTHIKKIIMDQSVAAGVGNWMADEILYQAKIHPKHKSSDLSEEAIERIFHAMKKVIEVAIAKDAHYADFPEDFMIHIRKEGETCFHTGGKIEKITVGGRTTYFSPEWQKV